MRTLELSSAARAAGLDCAALTTIYREERARIVEAHKRARFVRECCLRALGHTERTWTRRLRSVMRAGGDLTEIRRLDEAAQALTGAGDLPELGADNAAASSALWSIISAPAPILEPEADTLTRALSLAYDIAPRASVSPDDMVSTAVAAEILGKSEQWIRKLIREGKLAGGRIGGRWWAHRAHVADLADRAAATAGAPF